ncbi:PAS domain S-box protein [Natronomonas halophila]|uniref:PAS domain S-box protein n=1 Tax=Natronomonas halophila TaxID=2747817 RepID=UPI0015B44E04|nr:PAS domain S-box protein [Natronomonas halophila]QLD87242.1 PAS domain S-box protein [Natronomonas halophila]
MTLRAVHVASGEVGLGGGRIDAERVDSSREVLRRLDAGDVDCIVSGYDLDSAGRRGETGLDVLQAVRERNESVPFLLYTDRTDGDVAIEATRHGVTEYVSLERLRRDDMTLGDRVRALADKRESPALPYDRNAIAELTHIAASDDATFEDKVDELLDLGRDFLDLDIGFISQIEDETHTITHVRGNEDLAEQGPVDLSTTYCHYTVQSESLFGVRDAEAEGWSGNPVYEQSGLSCYLGGRITIGNELYGTLCFADEDPRALAFTDVERTFIELLVEWLGHEIAREKREASLRRYKAIHETVRQMVFVIGEEATIELLTEPLAERFGYDREELRGKSATALLDADAVQAGYEALDELRSEPGESSRIIKTELLTADGDAVPVDIELSLLSQSTDYRGLVGVIHDRSDLAETKAELAAERDRFRYLFEHIPDPVVITESSDGGDVIRAVNPAFESVFGYSEPAAIDRRVTDLIVPEEAHEESLNLGAEIRHEGSVVTEVRRNTTDGYRRFLLRGFEYQTGEGDRAFTIYTDITERAEREQYLKVVNRILRHNLRNDLSIIIGFADVLADDLEDEVLAERAETIESTATSLSELAEKANEMARIVGQRSTTTSHGIDLVDLVEDVRTDAATAHANADIVSTLSGECHVRADSTLARVLRELVDNAVTYADAETPRVEFDLRPSASSEKYVTLAVSDNGPGIPAPDRERVLGEREITQLDHAQGIGLWLVKWLTESYGGDLSFDVDEDGTTVLLTLPRHDGDEDAAPDSA